jgi:hypothetical protein
MPFFKTLASTIPVTTQPPVPTHSKAIPEDRKQQAVNGGNENEKVRD